MDEAWRSVGQNTNPRPGAVIPGLWQVLRGDSSSTGRPGAARILNGTRHCVQYTARCSFVRGNGIVTSTQEDPSLPARRCGLSTSYDVQCRAGDQQVLSAYLLPTSVLPTYRGSPYFRACRHAGGCPVPPGALRLGTNRLPKGPEAGPPLHAAAGACGMCINVGGMCISVCLVLVLRGRA